MVRNIYIIQHTLRNSSRKKFTFANLNGFAAYLYIIKKFNLKKKAGKMYGQVKAEEAPKSLKMMKRAQELTSQSDQFQLQYHQIKKLGLPVNKKKLKVGNWEPQENLIYLKFLQKNKSDFISEAQRRKNKVFYKLSKILKKRTPDQCRSHHQKLQMKYEDNIQEIIKNIQKKLEKKTPEILIQEYKKLDNSNKKTGTSEIVEESSDKISILKESSCYRILQQTQNVFRLEFSFNQMKIWP